SRRRHTISKRDWSSDVCSSDLGKFREDLYFRLNVIRVDIPPLRERREDIPILCNYFLCKYRDRYKSTVEEIATNLMDSFLRYDRSEERRVGKECRSGW